VSGTILAVTPAEAALKDPIGVNQGAAWLESQLTDGVVHNDQFDFDDLGLTADFALALNDIGGRDETVDDIVDTIEPRAQSEWYSSTFNGVTTTYGGSIAKALVLAQEAGTDPTSFGGVNLVTQLENHTAGSAPIAGRVQNVNDDFGDANVIGQAYAAHGLAVASSGEATAATNFLLQQQCPDGGFRLDFTVDKAAVGQSCTNNSEGQTDVTAIAVLQLASQQGNATVGTAITEAKAWLVSKQKTDGSWAGGPTTDVANANSTGLAASALGDSTVPEQAASEEAAQWLRAHQATNYDACDKLKTDIGAVAYDDAGIADGPSDGITEETQDKWRRASSQAVPALKYLPADPTPSAPVLTGPSGYLKAGSSRGLTTKGVRSGDKLCLTGPGASVQGTASGSTWLKAVRLPAGTATRTYRVRDSWGETDTGSVKVLGKKTLRLYKTKSRVTRSGWVTARIGGLASRESAGIYYKGNLVRSGKASTAGVFSASFKVGRALGEKQIVGHGQYGDIRRGVTSIRVVR
jgi:hypothetical protein